MQFPRLSRLFLVWLFAGVLFSTGPVVETCRAEEFAEASRVQSLDGPWHLAFDPQDAGNATAWFKPGGFPLDHSQPIEVPGNVYEVDPNYGAGGFQGIPGTKPCGTCPMAVNRSR